MQKATAVNFANLLELCAKAQPKMRIRFSTSNPQDLTLDVIETMAKYDNICNHIHLPVQSGSNRILKEMNRLHTREEYFNLIDNIKRIIPDCAISQDLIAGFPTETEQDHQDTLSLMDYVKYNFGYMFTYSERPGTMAERKMEDDVPEEVKKRRLAEIVQLQREHSEFRTKEYLNTEVEVLLNENLKNLMNNGLEEPHKILLLFFQRKIISWRFSKCKSNRLYKRNTYWRSCWIFKRTIKLIALIKYGINTSHKTTFRNYRK